MIGVMTLLSGVCVCDIVFRTWIDVMMSVIIYDSFVTCADLSKQEKVTNINLTVPFRYTFHQTLSFHHSNDTHPVPNYKMF